MRGIEANHSLLEFLYFLRALGRISPKVFKEPLKLSIWIELILLKLKTENWKHCSKIIFKCVNNAVGPIFNEKIDKKWNLWVREQCTDALFMEDRSKVAATVHVPYMNSTVCWGKRREKKRRKMQKLKTQQTWIQTVP